VIDHRSFCAPDIFEILIEEIHTAVFLKKLLEAEVSVKFFSLILIFFVMTIGLCVIMHELTKFVKVFCERDLFRRKGLSYPDNITRIFLSYCKRGLSFVFTKSEWVLICISS